MKKKLLVGILVLTMLAACLGVSAFAAEGTVTSEQALAALQAALKGTATEIKLTGDIEGLTMDSKTYAPQITITRDVTLDLNGHNLTGDIEVIRIQGANVKIVNSSSTKSTLFTDTSSTEKSYQNANTVTVLSMAKKPASLEISAVGGNIELKNSDFRDSSQAVIKLNGVKDANATLTIGAEGDAGKVTITAGTKTESEGEHGLALEGFTSYTDITINNAVVEGKITSKATDGVTINDGTFNPKPADEYAADGKCFTDSDDGKFTVAVGAADAEAEVTASNGRKVRGELADLVQSYKTKEITVLKSATLNLTDFGGDTVGDYSSINTINLKLAEATEEKQIKLTITGTIKVAKITVTGVTTYATVDSTGLNVVSGEEGKTYTKDEQTSSGTVTITSNRGLTEDEQGLADVVEVTLEDGTSTKINAVTLARLYMNSYKVNGQKVTGIKVLKELTLSYFTGSDPENAKDFFFQIPKGADITIDLNGNTVTYNGTIAAIVSQEGGKVTITDSSAEKDGKIVATSGLVLALGSSENNTTYGEAVVDTNATLEGMVGIYNKSTLTVKGTINGGESHAISSWEGPAPEEGEEKVSHDGTVVIVEDGGKVLSSGNAAIYMPQNGTVTVNEGGLVQGKTGILARDGEVVVDGGTVEATGKDNEPAIKVEKKDGYGDEDRPTASVEVKSGEVKSASGETLAYEDSTEDGSKLTDEEKEAAAKEQIKVEGGTFTTGSEQDEKGDTSANKYVSNDLYVNDEGLVNTFTAAVVDFGYAADRITALDTAAKNRPDWASSNYWNTTTHTGDSDWSGQTMWVTFNQALPKDKTVVLTVTPPAGGGEPFDVDCVGNGTAKTFAWSFLNPEQVPDNVAVPGNYTIEADSPYVITAGHNTVAVPEIPAGEDTVHFAILTGGADQKIDEQGFTVETNSDTTVGQYYEVTFSTKDLPMTSGNGSNEYYLGWALAAPEGAEKFARRDAATAEALLEETFTALKPLENRVVLDGDTAKNGYSIYYNAATSTGDWREVRWYDKDGKLLSSVIVHTTITDEVTFAPAVAEDAATAVKPAPLVNQAGADDDVAAGYEVTAAWNEANGYVDVTINASSVEPHIGANGIFGYWVGWMVKQPENAQLKSVEYSDESIADLAKDESAEITDDVYVEDDTKTAAYVDYLNAGNELYQKGVWYKITWTIDDKDVSVIYHVTVADDISLPEPEVPAIYPAILGTGKNDTANDGKADNFNVALSEDTFPGIGYYWEVTLNPGMLVKTTGHGSSEYYTGIALTPPTGATQVKYAAAKGTADSVTLGELQPTSLEDAVHYTGDTAEQGIAFYVTATDTTSLNKDWIRVQWLDASGNVVADYTIHLTIGEVSLLPDAVTSASIYEFSFVAENGKDAINKALAEAAKALNPDAVADTDYIENTDAGTNVMYAVFNAAVTSQQEITLTIKDSVVTSDDLTATISSYAATRHAGYICFSFDNPEQNEAGHSGGKYTVTLKIGDNEVTSKELELYKITYTAADTAEGEDVTVYVLAEDLDSALETVPSGFTATTGNATRVQPVEVVAGTYDYTVTVEGYTRTVSGGGASATTSKVTTPENGSVEMSSTTARGGQTVTVTATPDEGYDVGEVIVKDRNGNPVEVTKNDDGTYSYTVPAGKTPVTVEVVFNECLCDDFADLDLTEWYHEAVDYAIKSELMLGQGDGWHPTDAVRGAEIFVILGRLDGAGLETGGDKWYEESLAWAMEKGYTDGSTPLANCSRERAVTLLWRYYGEQASDADITGFVDAADVSDWALDAMKWAVENEIIKGLDNNDIQPKKDLTRAEFATILERLEAAPATETAE